MKNNAKGPKAGAMKFPIRQLPIIQNWSCHQCGNCCREYFVEVTGDEKTRIEQQAWHEQPEFQNQSLFVKFGRFGRRAFRLAHRDDGSCIFLNEQGLCRIHAKYGEAAKPIACQLYPYMIVPAGKELRVSVRFSCPSAVKNLGRPVKDQADQIRRFARHLIPENARPPDPPLLCRGQRVEWSQLLAVVQHLEQMLTGAGPNLPQRLIQAIGFVRLLEQAKVGRLKPSDFAELLDILVAASGTQKPEDSGATLPCSKWALTQFRLIVAQCARKDLSPHLRRGLRGRWGLLRAALQFARGRGQIPRLQPLFGDVEFAAVERPFGPPPQEAMEILERYSRIKLSGIQFFGSAFYGLPLVEGFYNLALTFPTILWIARWLAAAAGRTNCTADDIATALTVVDHQWGFSAALGFSYSRWRVRLLANQGQIERLIERYSA